MAAPRAPEVGGYVLAGGQSSRMGRDKALLALAGKPLILHAVSKLQRVCAGVFVLGNRPALAAYAPLVPDLHPGCGPMGGMEAALRHSRFEWNLFLPVDVPFVPAALLERWVQQALPGSVERGTRVLMAHVDSAPQPTLALVHRDLRPFLTVALHRGQYKLFPALAEAARQLAVQEGFGPEAGLLPLPCDAEIALEPASPAAQRRGPEHWFANLNTPEEFAAALAQDEALEGGSV